MSNSLQDQEQQSEIKNTLPLIAHKQVPIKVYILIVFIVLVFIGNHFLHIDRNKQKPDDSIDVYSLKTINPVTQNDHQASTNQTIDLQQDKLKQQLEEAKAKDFVERMQASQVVDAGGNNSVASSVSASSNTNASVATVSQSSDPNTAFLNSTSAEQIEHTFAERFKPEPYLIGQGKFIFGTLAVAINSDLPGQVSAIVNQDVYGEQGRHVLIPRGSRLIGEYRSGLATNQNRLFIVWKRVIQPNGISVMIGSEGTDALGQAGATGNVDYHFFARFGTATLISLIGAGASTVGVNPNDEYNSMAAYRQAVAQSMAQQASSTLSQTANIPPTIHVPQGTRIVVFVNRDLDFSRAYR